ncbi:imidazole glycerol phosphate synthase subunit HisH [Planctomycetales bacterium ZRK34]|nr:imidazole glycerol phosphate synthase subunit HisH [Planctomycetales bacterium ZRK34]
MIGIVDYGMGNLRSVQKALQRVGADAEIVNAGEQVDRYEKLIVPGVGAFKDAMTHLHERQLIEPIRNFVASGRYTLGICLGLQLLFETSTEDGLHEGLGVMPGRVVHFEPDDPALKVPHMGWNAIEPAKDDNPLLAGIESPAYVYFVHSYYADPAEAGDVATVTDYAGRFCSSVWRDNLFATQFHPEKSQQVGLKMLFNFAGLG